MMTGERIWGKQFIEELSKPYSDPEIRKMEEHIAKIYRQFLRNSILVYCRLDKDYLPACYKKVKV